jgi:hypothetical protein
MTLRTAEVTVAATDGDRGRVLIVRVWVEPGAAEGFRARLTTSQDVESGESDSTVVASPTAVLDAVRRWLDAAVA